MTARVSRPLLYVLLLLLPCAQLRGQATTCNQAPKEGSAQPPKPGEVRQNSKDGLKYVYIPPGTFQMGCSPGDSECHEDEKPAHQVTISKGLWIGQTEVTVGGYKRFAASSGRQMPPAPDSRSGWPNDTMPIVNVGWREAQAYCNWAGSRLPTEAEWEYAARGGSTKARYGPIGEVAWYRQNSGFRTHEVGQKRANALGLFDMLGNVWEWVSDWYDENYYATSPASDPQGPTRRSTVLLRGGSWSGRAGAVRVSFRNSYSRGLGTIEYGFRCVRDAAP